MKKARHIMVAIAIPLVLVIFTCFACRKEKAMITPPITMPTPDTTTFTPAASYKYLALGDSYTIGQNVAESDRFPAQTAKLLAVQKINIPEIKYIATTGWTTSNLQAAISAESLQNNFDIVTLLIGVNDQYQHVDTSTYRTRFTDLLHTSVSLAANRRARVVVVSIPDYSVTPFVSQTDKERVSKEIDAFNAINRQVTQAEGIAYVDITPASKEAANDRALIATDGLHPSGKQYAKWASLLAPVIKNVLK